ncbi:hypothetical protein [Phaeovulum sp. W22_SRMD_FR3]|uniref:hypothetical protein n=1 Tax=Phaeovulum sp. W22_SRMD_FR3 TaxID=3240274 RepID=UPI003F99F922
MKKIATLAIALTMTAGASFAGGYVAPVVEATPVVVEDNGSSSNAGLIVPALLLLGVIAAVASDS